MNRPSKRDVSRPRGDGYAYKKRFYRRADVAADYDAHRFGSPARSRRNARKWKTILSALEETEGVRSILDLPCGTGRFTGSLTERGYTVVGGDISHEMMQVARDKTNGSPRLAGWVQTDAESLPMRDASLDCVVSIRFMFHVDPKSRVRILREMGRVSRRWLIVDYRHRYSLRYAKWRLLRSLGFTKKPLQRVSREQLEREFHEAGVSICKVIPVWRVFSDKWIVVGESTRPDAA
jgi:ubiquinone/menaquinone biosynthesis C-methylase UbiE